MAGKYQICKRCIMDTTDPNINFDDKGVCNHCRRYDSIMSQRVPKDEEAKKKVEKIVKEIKDKGVGKKFDCIVGISGGVDSSYVLYKVKELGLKPLAVHLDNGWNSRIATRNIQRLLRALGIELYTYVIDWEEFKDLQKAYIKASVIDIEALTDHAIKSALYKTANNKGIKYIITGTNVKTEGMMGGSGWGHNKSDYVNILDIHKKYGEKELKTYPVLKLFERIYYQIIKNIQTIELLNYVPYKKTDALKILKEKFKWEDYGNKHGESSFTKFFQNYILPEKFGVDKRRPHLSALINAKEISRNKALEEMKKPLYPESELKIDKEYVIRKLDMTKEEFEKYMKAPRTSHYDFKTADKRLKFIRRIYKKLFNR